MADADTAAKRAQALGAGLGPGVLLPIPDSSVDAPDRAQLLGGFTPQASGGSDTTPDAFSFTDQFNVAQSSLRTSNAIAVSGIDTAAPISVTGGTYAINGGSFVSSSGTVNSGDTVQAQHTASASFSTVTDTVINIGGVTDTFSSTTLSSVSGGSMAPILAAGNLRRVLLS